MLIYCPWLSIRTHTAGLIFGHKALPDSALLDVTLTIPWWESAYREIPLERQSTDRTNALNETLRAPRVSLPASPAQPICRCCPSVGELERGLCSVSNPRRRYPTEWDLCIDRPMSTAWLGASPEREEKAPTAIEPTRSERTPRHSLTSSSLAPLGCFVSLKASPSCPARQMWVCG